ncbi:hypothetical protein DPMN_096912 [Dreissena polymorpha]|uniref:Uncharacterized protein n=1 Tax=Dreissena polymorpha TaxID=45954 RepID=A0A9D4R434_DREPO|nr:hypothetical protein DPMN_096912 [Dreissena polymorpha]
MSEQFNFFEKEWNFTHSYSSARNGKAENAAKNMIKQAKHSNTDAMIAFLNFRNTPQQSTCYSPAQQFF